MHKMKLIFSTILLILDFCSSSESKKCIQWTSKFVDHDGPSMVYTETTSPEDGIGSQLSVFAFLWTLRRFYNVDVFMSRNCHATLSRVFTEASLSDIPVLEDYFCNPQDIRFEFFTGNFEAIASRKEFRVGRVLWLWPSKSVLEDKLKKANLEDDHSAAYRGYVPQDHSESPAHDRLKTNALKWMKRQLVFQPAVQSEVQRTFETIAKKLDLKASQVTYVGIHHRRSPEHIAHFKKYHKKKPLKKAYFYDAMEEMRESYNNVAFLYASDDMDWGRSNIKDKKNDLYFVGLGSDDEAGDAFDFALLCQCNHSIITRGAFSTWVADWSGGEYYTEYGSIVPNEVNNAIEAEGKGQNSESFIYGSATTGEAEGLLFPDLKLQGDHEQNEDNSWSFW